jgi:hypothetical protein
MPVTKHNLDTALTYSRNAYNDNIVGSTKIECQRTSTTAFVHRTPHLDILVFRGTQQLRDWMFNIWTVPRPYEGRWAHAGFVRAHRSVWSEIQPLLEPTKKLLICGHSLGGALAELSAWKCRNYNAHLITFGKPNVFFNPSYYGKMPWLRTQLSVVCGSDLVARVPRVFFGPDGGQTQLYFDVNNKKGYINPSKSFKKKDWKMSGAVADHSMDTYQECVEAFDTVILPQDHLKF